MNKISGFTAVIVSLATSLLTSTIANADSVKFVTVQNSNAAALVTYLEAHSIPFKVVQNDGIFTTVA